MSLEQNTNMSLQEQVQESMQSVWITSEMFFKKRSLNQMIADEEEKQERLREEENKIKNIMAARRFLYSIGAYELEEGEILE